MGSRIAQYLTYNFKVKGDDISSMTICGERVGRVVPQASEAVNAGDEEEHRAIHQRCEALRAGSEQVIVYVHVVFVMRGHRAYCANAQNRSDRTCTCSYKKSSGGTQPSHT